MKEETGDILVSLGWAVYCPPIDKNILKTEN
jgi:hypothetical protein